ncbi:hypothetical protein FRB99_003202, partial [Tulasnella sp. 403]
TFDPTTGQLTAHWQDETGTGQPPFVTSTFYLAYAGDPGMGRTGSPDPIGAVQTLEPGLIVVPVTFYIGLS